MRNRGIFDFTDHSAGISFLQTSGMEEVLNYDKIESGNFVLVKDIFNQTFHIKLCDPLPNSITGWLGIISSNIKENIEKKPYKFGMLCFVDQSHFLDFSQEKDKRKEETISFQEYNISDYLFQDSDEDSNETII